MNLFVTYTDHVKAAVRALAARGLLAANLDLDRIVVEPPRDAGHGDLATNAAMVLAKEAGKKPRELAEALAAELRGAPNVAAVEVAGPGFINLALDPSIWPQVLAAALREGERFGATDVGRAHKVNIEYVSANPTGPMHVGHCRGAVFGDALANLMAFVGFDVTREYYINDAGAQVDVLARSAFLRYREALGEAVGAIPEGLYPGDYLIPVGKKLAELHGARLRDLPEAEWLPIVRQTAIDEMMAAIRGDLEDLNIRHDVFFSERTLTAAGSDRVAATIDTLRAAGHIYEGRLPPPKGAPPEDWEDREQTLFRATAFGDDVDRPLMKSDGSYTYFASDIAYHFDKFTRGFRDLVDVWGADHGGYIKRMQSAVSAITGGQARLDVKLCQLVRLFRNGEPVRMSKRSGDFITLREVVEEVGRDAVRFMMLYRKNDAVLDFDLAKVIEQSRDNPVFYVQYAHARCHSVLRNVATAMPSLDISSEALLSANLEKMRDLGEIDILKQIALWPRVVDQAAVHHEPHRIAFFLYDLASAFHTHWNRGKDLPYLRFIIENDPTMTSARLALVRGVAVVLAAGLKILGVEPVQEMR